ncbi:single-stranded DNA-binding protein [Gloeocapsa sp. PCC 73106]|uniref:single-stranded DNA-binding protein n=1 Tax=Gloeocapsa sp. PCC 73106 TaxID=102232 RepID=UPI0002AB9BB6|nr:single-stranded DNA-binding protein [Gloeocapsa sp. PCC 73106]ELR99654.1 single-stranded DNA-binding protein [Gloeocapsa sp. PCC 73106]
MNSCILMAKIISNPELRYAQDNQLPIAQMLIEIDGLGPNDPPSTLKAVGWGNLASEIKEKYTEGDQVILMGRLSMKNFESPEGFKEKRAELTLSQVYPLSPSATTNNVVPIDSFKPKTPTDETPEEMTDLTTSSPPVSDENLDEIPF